MVEYTLNPISLDSIFGSLADPTRRDILRQLTTRELSVSEIARQYDCTLASVSKHLKILEKARLIIKNRHGKQQIVQISPIAFKSASDYLTNYEALWNDRFDRLQMLLKEEK